MAALAQDDQSTLELKRRLIQEFIDAENPVGKYGDYSTRIKAMMDAKKLRILVSLDHLRAFDTAVAQKFLASPIEMLPVLESAFKDAVLDIDARYFAKVAEVTNSSATAADKTMRISVGFEGNFGSFFVNPRTLTAGLLSKLVCVEGIVTRSSLVRPKVVRSVHYCPKTGEFTSREYRDATDMTGLPTGSVYPTKDDNGNNLETEFGLSTYKDTQSLTIQEMPESSPLGQLPRSVDVYVEGDLVDLVKPGDRVNIVGIYRALANGGGTTNGMFRTILLANSVTRTSKEAGGVKLAMGDLQNLREQSKRPDIFELLSRSLAPSIYGHKYIKQALTLLLLGGVEHNLDNGTHLRGDINLLMVGDPSTAKSQLLRFVLNIAPLAVNTTGRGSSGVGLTAAVTNDPETGERRLEAGAMVLADRGVVCIDEFDKMSDADRVAIHEVMEQQTVTIAKAGIQASLNARCSVVAAANPVYGRFDNSLPLHRNVALPDSLLSRFDLLFIVRDTIDNRVDARLADHVLRMHRYSRPGQEGIPVPLGANPRDEARDEDKAGEDDSASPVFQKFNPLLHGGAAAEAAEGRGGAAAAASGMKVELLTLEFIQKYLQQAKKKTPRLTETARAAIVEAYNDFRQRAKDRATVITARSLETIIRLSSAHAKLRLTELISRDDPNPRVTEDDVKVAVNIMRYALYGDAEAQRAEGMRGVDKKKKASAAKDDDGAADDDGADGGDGGGNNGNNDEHGGDDVDGDDDDDDDEEGGGRRRRSRGASSSPGSKRKAPSSSSSSSSSGIATPSKSKKSKSASASLDEEQQQQLEEEEAGSGVSRSRSGKGKKRASSSRVATADDDSDTNVRFTSVEEDDVTQELSGLQQEEVDEEGAPASQSSSRSGALRSSSRSKRASSSSSSSSSKSQKSQTILLEDDGDDDDAELALGADADPFASASSLPHDEAMKAVTKLIAKFLLRRDTSSITLGSFQSLLAADGVEMPRSALEGLVSELNESNNVFLSQGIIYKL